MESEPAHVVAILDLKVLQRMHQLLLEDGQPIEDYKYPAGRFYEIYFLFHGESLNQINVYDEVRKADLKNYHREIAEHQFLFMFTLTSSSWCNTKLLGLSICARTCPRVTHVYLVAIRLIVTAKKLSSDAGRKKAK